MTSCDCDHTHWMDYLSIQRIILHLANHATYYLTLIETMHLSCTIIELQLFVKSHRF